jgi:farnesyl-diphosphate farnesyltransferase
MCRAHLVYRAELDDAALLAQGIRFGKGLQLTNILRDLPHDLRRGRCYLPRKRLTTAGLTPRDLIDSASLARFQPIYHHYLSVAKDHLKAGWDYTNRLPWSFLRLRLACSWPILIGLKTLNKLAHGKNILTTDEPVKISRGEVRIIILRSLISYPVPSAWRSLADFSR